MKKLLVILLSILLLCSCTGGKQESEQTENEPEKIINIGAMKGPTGIGLAYMMENHSDRYNFTLEGAVDAMSAKLINKEVDVAIIPSNLAAVINNKLPDTYVVISINALSNLYLLSKDPEITSIADLQGKKIVTAGQNTTVEYILTYLLEAAGVTPEVTYVSEHSEAVTQIVGGGFDAVLLPEPFVTTLLSKDPEFVKAVDLGAEFESASGLKLPMGAAVMNRELLAYPELVNRLIADMGVSASFAYENVEECAKLCEKFDIIKEAVAVKAIPNCNIALITGSEMRDYLTGYYQILFNLNPKAVGGALPAGDFYLVNE